MASTVGNTDMDVILNSYLEHVSCSRALGFLDYLEVLPDDV